MCESRCHPCKRTHVFEHTRIYCVLKEVYKSNKDSFKISDMKRQTEEYI